MADESRQRVICACTGEPNLGLVDPVDDFRPTNPASIPALLDALADEFVREKYGLRQSIRVIMNSRTYQASAEPNETNAADELNFSHALVRRLSAEQLLDGLPCSNAVAATIRS